MHLTALKPHNHELKISWSKLKPEMQMEFVEEAIVEFLITFYTAILGYAVNAWIALRTTTTGHSLVTFFTNILLSVIVGLIGGITERHLDPAVTLAMGCLDKSPWKRVLLHMIAQYMASFIGAAVVHLVCQRVIDGFLSGEYMLASARIYSTFPEDYRLVGIGLIVQVFSMVCLCGVSRIKTKLPRELKILIQVIICVIVSLPGNESGFTVNSAIDFGGRLFTAAAGWGMTVISYNNFWFWVPWLGPQLGAVLGVTIYKFITVRLPKSSEKVDVESNSTSDKTP